LGGRASEEIIFGDISSGASNDIEKATDMARRMVTQYGMSSKLGPIQFGQQEEMVFLGRGINEQRNYSDEIAYEIDKEVRQIIDRAYARAKSILLENKDKLVTIAHLLVTKETLEADEFEQLFDNPRPAPKPLFKPEYLPGGNRTPELVGQSEAAVRVQNPQQSNTGTGGGFPAPRPA